MLIRQFTLKQIYIDRSNLGIPYKSLDYTDDVKLDCGFGLAI